MTSHVHWLLTAGRFAPTPADLLSGLARRLCADGFDLIRVTAQPRNLHAEIATMIYTWRPQEAPHEFRGAIRMRLTQHDFGIVQELAIPHQLTDGRAFKTDAFRTSPFYRIYNGAPIVRAPIVQGSETFEFSILRDLAAEGATDYVALALRLGDGNVCASSFVTRKPGGFADADIATLESLLDPLAMCMEVHFQRHVARSLVQTYLGRGPGDAVLGGRVERGDVEKMEAAIWFSDLRDFTQASTTVEPEELVGWLNEYFGAIGKPIAENNGEILKFIGDAILAVFPVSPARSRGEACAAALRSAVAANAALDALNAGRATRDLPALQHGIALHVGEVQYGNIGADGRLDFTVIGQAVNLASRIASLCGKLARRTLASAELAELAGGHLQPVGAFELKGLPGEHAIHGL
jgi:adenylate cyclase